MALTESRAEEFTNKSPEPALELLAAYDEPLNPYDAYPPDQLRTILLESMGAVSGTTHYDGIGSSGIGARYVFRCLLECVEKGSFEIAPPKSVAANRSVQEFSLALDSLVRRLDKSND